MTYVAVQLELTRYRNKIQVLSYKATICNATVDSFMVVTENKWILFSSKVYEIMILVYNLKTRCELMPIMFIEVILKN